MTKRERALAAENRGLREMTLRRAFRFIDWRRAA